MVVIEQEWKNNKRIGILLPHLIIIIIIIIIKIGRLRNINMNNVCMYMCIYIYMLAFCVLVAKYLYDSYF